jgi:hypothetical protein
VTVIYIQWSSFGRWPSSSCCLRPCLGDRDQLYPLGATELSFWGRGQSAIFEKLSQIKLRRRIIPKIFTVARDILVLFHLVFWCRVSNSFIVNLYLKHSLLIFTNRQFSYFYTGRWKSEFEGFEVLTEVTMKSSVFWDVSGKLFAAIFGLEE